MKEQTIQSAIIGFLKAKGAVPIRINSGSFGNEDRFVKFNSEKGCSDILACYLGRFVAIEVKRPGGRTTDDQDEFARRVRASGGIYLIATDITIVAKMLEIIEGNHDDKHNRYSEAKY